ncbi:hypothetical protein BLA29_006683, partial [Euroglyphus maynei]
MDQRLPPLTCDNWTEWKTKTKIILNRLKLLSFVNDDQPSDKHKALDGSIVDMILLSMEDISLISLVKHCTTSSQLWQTLCNHFESSTTDNNNNTDSLSIATQIQPDTRDIQIQTSMLNLSNSLLLPDDFEELFALVQQLKIKLIETLSEIEDESLIIEKGNMLRQQFLDFIDDVENFCVPTIDDEEKSIDKTDSSGISKSIDGDDVSEFEPCKIEANSESHCLLKPTAVDCNNAVTYETIMTYENPNCFSDDQHDNNNNENEEVIDEILVYFKDSTSNVTVVDNDKTLSPSDSDNYTWLQTNDINLWSRLLLLDPEFLSKLCKFHCHFCGEYWLFDDDGN